MKSPFTAPILVRAAFVLICLLLGASLGGKHLAPPLGWVGGLAGLAFGLAVVLIDHRLLRRCRVQSLVSGAAGLLTGLACAWLLTGTGVFDSGWLRDRPLAAESLRVGASLGLGFLGMLTALRSRREDLALPPPPAGLAATAAERTLLLDGGTLADGRLPKLFATGFLDKAVAVPRFVLDDLRTQAETRDEIRRSRGRRGLDGLDQLQKSPHLAVSIVEDAPRGESSMEGRLIAAARRTGARLLTGDSDLARAARHQGVVVLHLGELTQAMRPMVAPGDEIDLTLVKEGKDSHQAVGFLPDGTMIVVNQAVSRIGTVQSVVVAGAVQTSAGRLIFAELKHAPD